MALKKWCSQQPNPSTRRFRYSIVVLGLLIAFTSSAASLSHDYGKMFAYARELLTRPPVQRFLKQVFAEELQISEAMQKKYGFPERASNMSESQFILLLQRNPKIWTFLDQYLKQVPEIRDGDLKQEELRKQWREKITSLIDDRGVLEAFKTYNDPTVPMTLEVPDGQPGYRNLKLHVGHTTIRKGKKAPADNLKQVWIDFINSAKKQLAINVYDFDLQEVADALVARARDGVEVRIGIDADVIKSRPEVGKIFEQLKKAMGISAYAVDSVGLNHQKIATKDWDVPKNAGVLFSSGNLTQSCIGPEGDLAGVAGRPEYSIPNANHVVTMDSAVIATLVQHQLTETLDMGLRGNRYPLGGAYKVYGAPSANGGKTPYVIVTFSPNGGLGNINNDIIAQAILKTRGPIRLLQFAMSAPTIEQALLARAAAEIKERGEFDFKSIGDTPFAMRDWSTFLSMSGYELIIDGEQKRYIEAKDSPWREVLGEERFQKLRNEIRVAPRAYGQRSWQAPDGASRDVTAKLHHKFLRTGDLVIIGTSYNFSESALRNNEQLLVVVDPELAAESMEMFDGLRSESLRSVEETAIARNASKDNDVALEPDSDAKKLEAKIVRRSGKDRCGDLLTKP